MRRLLPAVAALLLAPAGAHAAEVASGPLRATITADPWRVVFTDAQGKTVLSERAGEGLGFTTALGTYRATKVVSDKMDGPAYTATLATSDPAGATMSVTILPGSEEGVISLRAAVTGSTLAGVQSTTMGFDAPAGERYLGFGERNVAVDHRGMEVENYVSDGPYQPEERPAVALLVPQPGFRFRDDATYFPIPWLLSTGGYGVLVDNDETSTFDVAAQAADAWSTTVESSVLALRVFAGPRPRDVLRRFTATLGRQPKAAAPFFFGPWWQPTKPDDPAALKTLQEAGAAGSLVNTYTHYLPCGDQTGKEQAQTDRTTRYHDAGLAITTYFNPMICTGHPRYGEAKAAGVLTKNAQGQPYEYRYQGSTNFSVAQFDFTAPGTDAFYAALLGEATGHGYDGWMEDFGEYTPADSVAADGTPGDVMHNRYVTLYHRSARRFAETVGRPLARFNRSGWTGTAQYAQIVWGGDPSTDWGFDGLTSAVRQGLSMGLSGVSLWGSDIGGYFALGSRKLSPELLRRWIEFGFASGVMRTEANGYDLPEHGDRPQITDEDVLPVWRRYARLRTQLYPYLAAAQGQYDRTGMPMMRHLALAFPDDPKATGHDDEYLLGDSLLVAPVLGPGETERALYLPKRRWVDLWRSATLTKAATLRLGAAKVLDGGADVTLPAPHEEIPLLVRAGSVLPLLPAAVDTLSDYGSARGLVHLRDRQGVRALLAFPRGTTRSLLGPGEWVRSSESGTAWSLRLHAKRGRTYRLQASLATLRDPYAVCAVEVGGRRLQRGAWRFDTTAQVLRATFRAGKRGRLVARRCPN